MVIWLNEVHVFLIVYKMVSKEEQLDYKITWQIFIICHEFKPTIPRQKVGLKKGILKNHKGKDGTISADRAEIRLQLSWTLQKVAG